METASIYWDTFTFVDHALRFPDGRVLGNSFGLSAVVEGPIETEEGVVIDFSTGKKTLKSIIDGPLGVDHKLWHLFDPVEGSYPDTVDSVARLSKQSWDLHSWPTDANFSLPLSPDELEDLSFYDDFLEYQYIDMVTKKALDFITPYVRSKLSMELGVPVQVTLIPEKHPFVRFIRDKDASPKLERLSIQHFRYTHGLPYSTSYGCQNMMHGHLSALRLLCPDHKDNVDPDDVLREITGEPPYPATHGHGWILHFYNKHYSGPVPDAGLEVERFESDVWTRSRGPCKWSVPSTDLGILVPMKSDPTVENLLHEVFVPATKKVLEAKGVKGEWSLHLSEGLSKGGIAKGTVE